MRNDQSGKIRHWSVLISGLACYDVRINIPNKVTIYHCYIYYVRYLNHNGVGITVASLLIVVSSFVGYL